MVMLSHLFIGVNDFERAMAFYRPVLGALGLVLRFTSDGSDRGRPGAGPWAGWHAPNAVRPLLLVGTPHNGSPATPGNGTMTALLAPDRATVDHVHATALAHGGTCNGPPGPRPHYHPGYYGAYFLDPEGNRLALAWHG